MAKIILKEAKLPKFNIEGQAHFVTIKTFKSYRYFSETKCCDIFLQVVNKLREELKYMIFGFVIMLDHVHLLIQPSAGLISYNQPRVGLNSSTNCRVGSNSFEPGSGLKNNEANEFASTLNNISYVIKRIKGMSAREINKHLKKSGNFWQKDFYDFNIFSEKKFREKLNYMHANPVRAGLAKDPSDWGYSSYKNYGQNDSELLKVDRL